MHPNAYNTQAKACSKQPVLGVLVLTTILSLFCVWMSSRGYGGIPLLRGHAQPHFGV